MTLQVRTAPVRLARAKVYLEPGDAWSVGRGYLWLGLPAVLADLELQPLGAAVGVGPDFHNLTDHRSGRRYVLAELSVTTLDVPADLARVVNPDFVVGTIGYYVEA